MGFWDQTLNSTGQHIVDHLCRVSFYYVSPIWPLKLLHIVMKVEKLSHGSRLINITSHFMSFLLALPVIFLLAFRVNFTVICKQRQKICGKKYFAYKGNMISNILIALQTQQDRKRSFCFLFSDIILIQTEVFLLDYEATAGGGCNQLYATGTLNSILCASEEM